MVVEDTESVSAGEVCSLKVAKTLNIDDINNNSYYLNDYSDVKTYNDTQDNLNNTHLYKLCEPTNITETKSAPLCVLESNAGFGFTKKRNPTTLAYDSCVTAECPKDFIEEDNSCKKPKKPKTILLNSVVEDRWYDWFMIPDYHLGNKYSRVDGINYAPCEKDSVPSYGIDPVDNSRRYFNDSKDDLGKCVEKTKYFGGKYFTSETYCPLSWIYRAGATKKDLKHMYEDLIENIDNTDRANEYLDILKNKVDNLIHTDIYQPVINYGFKDYVGESRGDHSKTACGVLESDPEKMRNARIICETIKQLGKEQYIEKLMNENNEDENIAKKKYGRAIQACHTVFCDNDNICFEEVKKKNLEKDIMEDEKINEGTPIVEAKIEKPKIILNTSNIVKYIIILFVISVVLIFLAPVIYMFLKKITNILKRLLGFITEV